MSISNRYKLKEISSNLNISLSAVQRIVKGYETEIEFKSSSEKLKETVSIRNHSFTEIQQLIFNILSCNSSLTLSELKHKLQEILNIEISLSTIS